MKDMLLYCFLQDYSIADKTDLNGNKIGGYEIISSGSVGGHMQNMCFNYIISKYSRNKIVEALLEIRKIDEDYFGPDTATNWSKPTDLHDAKMIAIQDICRRLCEYKGIEDDLKGSFGSNFELY